VGGAEAIRHRCRRDFPKRLKAAAQEELTKLALAQEKRQREKAAEYRHLEDAHPIATVAGEVIPAAAAPLLRVAQGGGLAATMTNTAASAALPAMAEYGTAEERGVGGLKAAAGGALGGAVAKGAERVVGKVLKPVEKVQSESLDEAIAAAQRLGISLTPGEMTGSKAVQAVEARLAKMPGSSGAMQQFQRARDIALNRAAAKGMGETADEITPEVFARASKRIGGEFERLSSGREVALGEPFQRALATLGEEQSRLGKFADGRVNELINDGMELAQSGKVDGRAYQSIRSSLGKKAKDAFASGQSELGQALKTVRDAMDEAAEVGMTGADKEAWGLARKQWAVLKTLEKGNVVEGGKVSAGRAKEALRTARPKDYKEGRLDGEMMDIAKFAETFKPLPDSGTAQNLFVQGLLTGVNPAAGAASVALPWAAQKGMFSSAGTNYLTKGRAVSPLEKALMERAARVAALGSASELSE
jgi:hypothetical protein